MRLRVTTNQARAPWGITLARHAIHTSLLVNFFLIIIEVFFEWLGDLENIFVKVGVSVGNFGDGRPPNYVSNYPSKERGWRAYGWDHNCTAVARWLPSWKRFRDSFLGDAAGPIAEARSHNERLATPARVSCQDSVIIYQPNVWRPED